MFTGALLQPQTGNAVSRLQAGVSTVTGAGEGICRKALGLSWQTGEGDVWGGWRQKKELSGIKIHFKLSGSSGSPVPWFNCRKGEGGQDKVGRWGGTCETPR